MANKCLSEKDFLERRIDRIEKLIRLHEKERLDKIEKSFKKLEIKKEKADTDLYLKNWLDKINGRLDKINGRLNKIEERLDNLPDNSDHQITHNSGSCFYIVFCSKYKSSISFTTKPNFCPKCGSKINELIF